jgi:hypothetical protein
VIFAAHNMMFTRTLIPAFDAVGGGANLNNQSVSPRTITWSHTAAAGAYAVVAVSAYQSGGSGIASITATYDGVSMTSLGNINPNSSAFGKLALFGLPFVPGGAKTVTATGTSTSGAVTALVGNSVSYTGASSARTVTTGIGSGNSVSVSATGVQNGIAVAAFGAAQTANGVTISPFDKTQRYVYNSGSGTDTPLIIGDTAATGSLSFNATLSGPSCFWDGIAVVLT